MELRVISLGWGLQSTTLAVMAALGDIHAVDVAIHADTTHERAATYDYAKRWTPWLEERGVRVVTVTNKTAEPVDRFGGVYVPAYTPPSGTINRQCTQDWKVSPLRRYLQANRHKERVQMLIGISLDEISRMRISDVRYIENSYPLVDMRMTRGDCVLWLERHGIEIPSKSACVFCPYQSKGRWLELTGRDAERAVAVDERIRNARPLKGQLFVHPSMKPLSEVLASHADDPEQLDLWQNECQGMCGV